VFPQVRDKNACKERKGSLVRANYEKGGKKPHPFSRGAEGPSKGKGGEADVKQIVDERKRRDGENVGISVKRPKGFLKEHSNVKPRSSIKTLQAEVEEGWEAKRPQKTHKCVRCNHVHLEIVIKSFGSPRGHQKTRTNQDVKKPPS